jgi:uncharacterized cupin superfamily protein
MNRVNLRQTEFPDATDKDGFRARRARLGWQLGTERLGVSLWEVPPGQAAYPYHFHYGEEELLLIIDGTPSLRTPDGWQELTTGDLVALPRGKNGAHQLVNRASTTAVVISISTNGDPEIIAFPDSGKIAADERRPDGQGFRTVLSLAEPVGLFEDEHPPRS